jgi:hypothetical protein
MLGSLLYIEDVLVMSRSRYFAGDTCGRYLREILAGDTCGRYLREILAGDTCGRIDTHAMEVTEYYGCLDCLLGI